VTRSSASSERRTYSYAHEQDVVFPLFILAWLSSVLSEIQLYYGFWKFWRSSYISNITWNILQLTPFRSNWIEYMTVQWCMEESGWIFSFFIIILSVLSIVEGENNEEHRWHTLVRTGKSSRGIISNSAVLTVIYRTSGVLFTNPSFSRLVGLKYLSLCIGVIHICDDIFRDVIFFSIILKSTNKRGRSTVSSTPGISYAFRKTGKNICNNQKKWKCIIII